jgi:hypothetical protein
MPAAARRAHQRPPRRARYLVPLGTSRRSEILAVLAVAAVVPAALFAPLTLLLTLTFHTVSKISRWRPCWLAVPACCGAVWLLAIGPAAAGTAFTAGMTSVAARLRHLVTYPAGLGRLPVAQAHELAGQLPAALILAAGLAGLVWWAHWLHTDEWALPPARPGLASFCRRRWTAACVRSGGIVTRNGACLGLDRATGRPAALSWREAGAGVLVTGVAQTAVLASSWQLVHAAIRRRKPVFVVDLAGSRELPGMLAAVCAATAAPLQVFGDGAAVRYEPGRGPAGEEAAALRASPLGRQLGPGPAAVPRIRLADVVRQRAVVLFALDRRRYGGAAEAFANLVAADIAAVYSALGGNGVPSEGLAWFTECAGADPQALAGFAAPGSQAGLASVLTTTVPATAARLAGQVGTGVFHRLADWDLAAEVAILTGTRLVPVSRAPARHTMPEGGGGALPQAGTDRAVPPGATPVPVVPADTLCGLDDDEFVLVNGLTAARGADSRSPSLRGARQSPARFPPTHRRGRRPAPWPDLGGWRDGGHIPARLGLPRLAVRPDAR